MNYRTLLKARTLGYTLDCRICGYPVHPEMPQLHVSPLCGVCLSELADKLRERYQIAHI